MLINPFKVQKNIQNSPLNYKNKECVKEIEITKIQDYLVENYLEYLQNDFNQILENKVKEYLLLNYSKIDDEQFEKIKNKLFDKLFGYGILQKYIDLKDVSDIRAVKYNEIYIKQKGKWIKTKEKFNSEEEFINYIRYCFIKNNSSINYENPLKAVSDKKYNIRIEAGIYPVNIISPSLVIRIHSENRLTLDNLFKEHKMLDKKSYNEIIKIINTNGNLIISGKGGSGKTTLLRAIINHIPETMSIAINEDTSEIRSSSGNIIERETIIGRNEKKIELKDLMKSSLLESNDILVVGELKGEETSYFIDAISTGHIGYATIHSNNIENVLNRLVLLFKRDEKNSKYERDFIYNLFASCIDYLIYMKQYKVDKIVKVIYSSKRSTVYFKNIYSRNNEGEKECTL